MTGCDCGGNTHNEEHSDDCAGWRLEVERLRADVETLARRDADYWTKHCNAEREVDRLREALRDVAERQREACARSLDGPERKRMWASVVRATPLVTDTE